MAEDGSLAVMEIREAFDINKLESSARYNYKFPYFNF